MIRQKLYNTKREITANTYLQVYYSRMHKTNNPIFFMRFNHIRESFTLKRIYSKLKKKF